MTRALPDHLARGAARAARRPDLRIVDVRWVLGTPGAGRPPTTPDTSPAPSSSTSTLIWPRPAARAVIPCPTRRLQGASRGGRHRDADEVVAYDDAGGSIAARLWWMLDDLGHAARPCLDGGLAAWLAAGYPDHDRRSGPRPRGQPPSARCLDERDRSRRRRAGLGRIVLLDARGAPRYRGEVEPIDPVAGHIPTASNAPADGNLGPDRRLLLPAALAARFHDLGATDAMPGRHLVRQRRDGLLHQPRDARRRPARPDPLPGLVQRLEPIRTAGRHRTRTGRPAGPAAAVD